MKWNLFKYGHYDKDTGKFVPKKSSYIGMAVLAFLFFFGLFKCNDAKAADFSYELTVAESIYKSDGPVGEIYRGSLIINDVWSVSLAYATDQKFDTLPPIDDYLYISIDRRVYLRSIDKKVRPWVSFGFVTLPTVKVDENWRVPLPVEFHLQAAFNINKCIGNTTCVIGWDHISNGGLRIPNRGENAAFIGFQHKF